MKRIQDINLKGKRVLVRVDFNVSLDKNQKVLDDFRLRATLPTIDYLVQQEAKIILLAHLGRPKPETKKDFSLAPVAERLGELTGKKIILTAGGFRQETKERVARLESGEILMLENLRWYEGEEKNDENFAKELAGLGEVYLNDAFAVSHRAHASVQAITKFLPSAAGLLLTKEVEILSRLKDNPETPLCVVIGGSKISTKIKLIRSFFGKAQDILLGGALANTVLHAKGIAVGRSMIEEDVSQEIKELEITSSQIHLPVDTVVSVAKDGKSPCRQAPVGNIKDDEIILDIGPDSEKLFANIIKTAKMIVWNGPIGFFEVADFTHGSLAIARAIADSGAFSVVGGGETVAFVEQHGLLDKFSFVSTGGGAMLEFLSGETLPGLKALE